MEVNENIKVAANSDKVWKVLTDNVFVPQYMFGCKIKSEWKEGDDIVYYMGEGDEKKDMVSGRIIKLKEPNYLHHSLFPVGADFPDIPANHIYVYYTLEDTETGCNLSVKQDGFSTAAEGEKRYESAKNGWDVILEQIKELAEKE